MKKLLTIRQYANKIGVSHTTVQNAINSGRISKGCQNGKINEKVANEEWGDVLRHRSERRKANEAKKVVITQQRLDDLCNIPVAEIVINADDDIKEAERKKLIIQGQRELIKLKAESGELVNKEAMYKEMFEFGKELRLALQAIPDRIIDELLTLDRHNAHRLLTTAINETLEKLSENEEGH
ncbi:MAG: hypothetical protein JSS64_07055 [Bacteroidetes bacterium]|nr:hypothetical protein [Bacteroidota bacterium]